MPQAGDHMPGQDGCVVPLAEHRLLEGSPALPFPQGLVVGCSLQGCTSAAPAEFSYCI